METFLALLAICEGNSLVPVTRSFGVFFDLRLNKRLSKQSWGWQNQATRQPHLHHPISYHTSKGAYVTKEFLSLTLNEFGHESIH